MTAAVTHMKKRPGVTLCGRGGFGKSFHGVLYTTDAKYVDCKNCLNKIAKASK